jgi:class 3 adenylate cyclase
MQVTRDKLEQAGRPDLRRLLSERNQYPERTSEIDEKIRQTFERRVAILVLDMCGFSRLTSQHGIIHFLAMVCQMEQGACPAVTGNGGEVIKQEADNLFAIFAQPAQALEAALDIFRAFEAMNEVTSEERNIYGSIGIGFGDTLVIGSHDLFGHEMNLACKLGEDLAAKMEILLTPAAHDALPLGRYACTPDSFLISGLELHCQRFQQCLYPRPRGEAVGKVDD